SLRSHSNLLSGRIFATIFFGGGTPTMLPATDLVRLLDGCRKAFSFHPNPEVSVEVNPATIDREGLLTLRQGGFNRISIGLQSLDDTELRLLGRPHDMASGLETARLAKSVGFTNLSLDLMYGLPGQTAQQWRINIQRALELAPQHLSIYELTPEEGTPLAALLDKGIYNLPLEDDLLEMMEITVQECETQGIKRYEISNYALPGFECEHNRNYWLARPYLGLGPGAVSRLGDRRTACEANLDAYCLALEQSSMPSAEEEFLDPETLFREAVILGLRTLAGVSISQLKKHYHIELTTYYGETLTKLIRQNFLVIENNYLRLTPQGLPIANSVASLLV
ncbi:MAG: radical SAM family heme chaperone HemW, partial [Desulfobulbaceae bacterium]|nr:radical SAM family heme chaperone HemW [Desulfobulbaceae bacterium]